MKKIFFIPLLSVFFLGCSDSTDTSENGLSASYPTDLAVTSPFGEDFALEGLTKLSTHAQIDTTTPIDVPSIVKKKEELEGRLISDTIDGCKFSIDLFRPAKEASCYGPAIAYENFDGNSGLDGTLPSGDVGIWKATDSDTGEACIAAKINSLISEGQAQIDMATNLVTGMLCIANLKGTDTLPSVGETKDYKDALTEVLDSDLSITKATIERLEDSTTDDNPVYLSSIITTGTLNGKKITADVNLKHIPTSDDNSAYRGQLWYTISGDIGPGQNCNDPNSKLVGVSIVYSKESDTDLTYRLQRADYCSLSADPFDSKKNLDPNGNWSGNFNDATFQYNPQDGTGTFSYAWQAGQNDSHTRALLAELNKSDLAVTGCGYFGFGPRVQGTDVGNIDGMICNWAGPFSEPIDNHTTIASQVQQQCVEFNSTTKKFDSTVANIDYIPTTTCSTTAESFYTFGGKDGSLTPDLVDLSTLLSDITPPTKPSNP